MTTVVDVASSGEDDERRDRDPFSGERIEVDETEFRRVSPGVWLAGAKRRLDATVQRLTYGR